LTIKKKLLMLLKQLFIVISSSLLLACAAPGTDPDGDDIGAQPGRSDCISSGTIRDYRVLDDANLVVSGTGSRKYHLTLSRRAIGLRSSWKIGFRSTTGQICGRFGEIIVDDGMGPESIRIASIRQLTPEEHDALLVRFGKKEPEYEQTPAPKSVESAEVEELD
jgi:hypothetical protein